MPYDLNAEMRRKLDRLLAALGAHKRLAVAFSAGVDSTLVARASRQALGRDETLALFASSHSLLPGDEALARRIADDNDFALRVVGHPAFETPGFADNSPQRCYICKRATMARILEAARAEGFDTVADGTSADDMSGDYRPGMRASRELGILSPLRDLGWRKPEVRAAARFYGLENWDRPSEACLATRIPYGMRIEEESLSRIARAEAAVRAEGFASVRVRAHGDVARIEVAHDEIAAWADPALRERICAALRAAGFRHVALDLEGYRTGSMNTGIEESS